MVSAVCALALAVALRPGFAAPPAQAPPPTPATPSASTVDPWEDPRPFTRLFQNYWQDLMATPSAQSAAVLVAGASGAVAVLPIDDDLSHWAKEAGGTALSAVGDVIGHPWTQMGGAIAAYAAGRIAGRPKVVHVGGDLFRAQMLTLTVTAAVKLASDRTRPNGESLAFPSGHTSATFTSAAVLHGHFGWKVGLPAYAVAGAVGWSRVRDQAHWLSDVAFGAAIGIVSGMTVTSGHRARAWIIVPMGSRRSVGIVIVKAR